MSFNVRPSIPNGFNRYGRTRVEKEGVSLSRVIYFYFYFSYSIRLQVTPR